MNRFMTQTIRIITRAQLRVRETAEFYPNRFPRLQRWQSSRRRRYWQVARGPERARTL